jgi:uncharacterized protein YegJ (DUF2314 family)
MSSSKAPLVSIGLLLKEPEKLDLTRLESAAKAAFRDMPQPPKVIPVGPQQKDRQMFGVVLGPLVLGVIQSHAPYLKDIDSAADRIANYPAKLAMQSHTAWMSVDKMRDCPLPENVIYSMIGRLLAEFLGNNTLGIILLPAVKVIGYDFSFIPLFRNGRALEAFRSGVPDRVVMVNSSEALEAATAEAKTRWPEFVIAFEKRQRGQGFAVKKKFVVGGDIEHMWVEVFSLDGDQIGGRLANEPQIIKEIKLRDPVSLDFEEIEDWMFSIGRQNFGGFQAKVIQAERDAGNQD